MRINNRKFDLSEFGRRFWLVGVNPVYAYSDDGKRTTAVKAHRYETCLADCQLEKIGIIIDGEQQLQAPENGYVEVNYTGLEFYVSWSQGEYCVGARAKGINAVNNKA